ncbi:MAG: amino acid adenylation domain-containing protein [Chthoniobacteraceae bacterium]
MIDQPIEIEDRYPLTPLQQGMLYHALSAPGTGVDIEQMVCTLREPVDAGRLRAAWEQVIARHAILRTAFRWDDRPMQEVAARVELPWTCSDATPQSEAHLTAYLREDRAAGFDMSRPPLMRLRLFRFGAEDFRLVWTFHHALLDGRSFPIVLREVFGVYDDTAELPAPRPYRAFIDWLAARDPRASEPFWRTHLAGFTAPTPIPVEGIGELAPEPTQGDADTRLSADSTACLRELAREHDLTLNTIVQGAWALLLARYSGEEDVAFGATRACRRGSVDGSDEMVGLFINTLPVRARIVGDAEVLPWLAGLREQWIAMRPHEHTPLASVQARSSVPGGKPLFDTIVVFENYDLDSALRAQGGAWSHRHFRLHEQTNFALTLAAYAGEQLRLRIEFDRHRFADATITRLLGHLTTLLESIAANPRQRLGDLPILTADEQRQLIREWNPRATVDAPEKTLHQLFAGQAARTPDAVAVCCDDARLTYAELDRRAAQLAHHLRALGVGPEVIVGLCVERSLDLVVGVLGILKAGGAYLPIDLAYPPGRLAFMLDDAQAPVVVTQKPLVARLPQHGATIVCIDDFTPTGELHDDARPDTLAYVIYTSGSTGQPKGCCITHRNVVRLMAATQPWFRFDARDVWTMFHSVAFDFSVWEIWGALLYGGRLIVVPHAISRSPEAFHELLSREQVTVLNQTPSAFRQLIAADKAPRDLALRLVIFGGEALEMQSLRPWFDRHGDEQPQLVNMYGITETTVHVTYRPLRAADVQRGSVIGVPIPDLEVFILDAALRPVPIGVPGEMFVGGAGLARGYLRRDELTAQRFIPHPWREGERLYRTGDLARWLPARDIEYLGRIDQQVKIRGFRIELGEIESALVQHPGVREAVVVAREQRLIGYLVASNGTPPPAHELRAHLKTKLPDYMVPAAFVVIDRVPLTNNGKTDLRALPNPEPERPETGVRFVDPRNPAEEALAAIWRRVLRIERVGVHDNFFDLGGDSILSILVVAQARQAGLTLSPKLLFDRPTISELAAATPSAPAPIDDEDVEGDIPLTPIQRWFFEHEFDDQNHWNQALTFNLATPIPHEELDRAVQSVARRHAAFHLRFTRHGDGWHQHLAASPGVECETLAHADEAAAHAALDITTGPLLRVVQSLEPSPRVLIVAHHLVMDGVSWRVLMEDLDAALAGRPLAAPTTSFARWAQLLAQAADAPALRDELPHWHELATSPAPPLPLDFADGENTEASARTIAVALSAAETALFLQRRANDVLLAALARALGRDSLVVDVEGHGREEALVAELAGAHTDLSHTIGWFTSLYPARTGEPAPHRGLGYGLLRHQAGLAPRSRAQVLFNYLGQFDALLGADSCFALDGLSTGGWHSPRAHRTHVIEINCVVIGGQLEARWTYSENLHRAGTIAQFAENFLAAVVKQLAPADSLPLSPIQQLYYTLESAQPGAGFDQWHGTVRSPLDVPRYRDAWRHVIDRHPALRTGFHGDGGEARQRIHDSAAPEWVMEDWRGAFTESRFAEFLGADSARGFDLTRPPLTRLSLLRMTDDTWRFVWSHHHLQIDGWSWPIVLREVAAAYRGDTLPPAQSYTSYFDWLAQRPADLDTGFWRAHLRNFPEPTPLPCDCGAGTEQTLVLDQALSQRLRDIARAERVTISAIAQAAWALLLAQRSGRSDVIFGASFSGRPADLPGVEGIVGPMVNNLPVRATLAPDEPLEALVRRLHEQSFSFQEHQFTPLQQIHSCSELPWRDRLFDTLVVVQNYITGGDLMIEDLVTPIRTNYPLTLVVTPGGRIAFTLIGSRESGEILGWLQQILTAFSTGTSVAIPRRAEASASPRARSTNFVAPRSAIEKQIAGVWREAFGTDEVGVRDNFFDLGGHSLLMLRVHARLREVLKRDISVVRMFQHPTIESLARHLDGSTTNVATAARERAARQRAALTRRS